MNMSKKALGPVTKMSYFIQEKLTHKLYAWQHMLQNFYKPHLDE